MLDHLIFNKLKWFNVTDNADNVKANGRNYEAIPSQVKVPAHTEITLLNDAKTALIQFEKYANKDTILNCVGVVNNYYCCTGEIILDQYGSPNEYGSYGTIFAANLDTELLGLVPKSQVQVTNWGGKALLSHLYQWFRSLYRMVAIAC